MTGLEMFRRPQRAGNVERGARTGRALDTDLGLAQPFPPLNRGGRELHRSLVRAQHLV